MDKAFIQQTATLISFSRISTWNEDSVSLHVSDCTPLTRSTTLSVHPQTWEEVQREHNSFV